jgi:archaemetzincin
MPQFHTKIMIVPVILESDKLHSHKERQYAGTIAADFYPRLIKQLLNIFNTLVTTINVYDSLMLDKGSTANSRLFNNSKNQWNSESILGWISSKTLSNNDTKILAICDFDAYSNGLNFIFGEAQIGGRVGAIYLSRLRQEFYGLVSDVDLLQQRITKEAVHELGHLFRLFHCERRNCVMHFSNSLHDTDFKDYYFCDRCIALLFNMYQ